MNVTATNVAMTPAEFAAIRVELGYTQGQLAAALFIARSYANELENGRRPISTHVALLMDALRSGWRPPPPTPKRKRSTKT